MYTPAKVHPNWETKGTASCERKVSCPGFILMDSCPNNLLIGGAT